MGKLNSKIVKMLLSSAKEVSKNSYSPYSRYIVGAAVLTDSGKVYNGTNIENVSYGLTLCAERVAIGNAITNGEKHFVAIAIYSPNGDITPCGSCRQVIGEFGANIKVIYQLNGKYEVLEISELLPYQFKEINII